MKIYLTAPLIEPNPTESRLWKLWLTRFRPQDNYEVWRPAPGEYHDELLTRIWEDAVARRHTHPHVLILDMDFIPYNSLISQVERDLRHYKLLFTPYFTRDQHGVNPHPFVTGLWFWAIDFTNCKSLPRPDFPQIIGRPMDVGGGSLFHFLNCDFCTFQDVKFYSGIGDPITGFVDYPDLGIHVFHHRVFAEPLTNIIQSELRISVASHLASINKILDKLSPTPVK